MPAINTGNALCLCFVSIVLLSALSAIHEVKEGHLGIYKRGGKVLERTEMAGYHVHTAPFIDSIVSVQHTVQTDAVKDVPCGTSGGVMIEFGLIEVVNQLPLQFVHSTVKNFTEHYEKPLIVDQIHALVNQFCSMHTLEQVYITEFSKIDDFLKQGLQQHIADLSPGLIIRAVRVTKPKVPEHIESNYIELEVQKTAQAVEGARQIVAVRRAETEARVAQIQSKALIAAEEAKQKISAIQDATKKASDMAVADAEYYAMKRKSEGYALLLTKEYLELERYKSAMANAKLHYFGPDVPAYLGALTNGNN